MNFFKRKTTGIIENFEKKVFQIFIDWSERLQMMKWLHEFMITLVINDC